MSNLGWTAVYYGFSWRSEQVGKVEDGSWKSTHFTWTLPIVKSSSYHAYCSTYIDIESIWHNCVSKDLRRKGLYEHRSVAFVWLQVFRWSMFGKKESCKRVSSPLITWRSHSSRIKGFSINRARQIWTLKKSLIFILRWISLKFSLPIISICSNFLPFPGTCLFPVIATHKSGSTPMSNNHRLNVTTQRKWEARRLPIFSRLGFGLILRLASV